MMFILLSWYYFVTSLILIIFSARRKLIVTLRKILKFLTDINMLRYWLIEVAMCLSMRGYNYGLDYITKIAPPHIIYIIYMYIYIKISNFKHVKYMLSLHIAKFSTSVAHYLFQHFIANCILSLSHHNVMMWMNRIILYNSSNDMENFENFSYHRNVSGCNKMTRWNAGKWHQGRQAFSLSSQIVPYLLVYKFICYPPAIVGI